MPPSISVFPVTPLSTFRYRIQTHSVLQSQPPLQSRRCNRPSLPPKLSIHLSCHFSVKTHHKDTLQPKLGILIYLQDQYLNTTSNVNISPTQSANPTLKYCLNVIYQSGHKPGSLRWEIGVSPIR